MEGRGVIKNCPAGMIKYSNDPLQLVKLIQHFTADSKVDDPNPLKYKFGPHFPSLGTTNLEYNSILKLSCLLLRWGGTNIIFHRYLI